MKILKLGQAAPAFSLLSQDNEKISLKDFKGKAVILYFYPKDDTPGCTQETCDFQDNFKQFSKLNAIVLGLSKDSTESHKKFRKKYGIKFTLLSDEKLSVIKKYGVWKEKSLYGRKYMGIERTTFLIDQKGKIAKIYPKVKVTGHVAEVMRDLESIV